MKSVLISIQPNPCALIVSAKKTIEVRRTRPKLETPFRCYIYETLGKMKWGHIEIPEEEEVVRRSFQIRTSEGRGKVIGEFVCDKISVIGFSPWSHCEYVSDIENLYKASCLNFDEMFSYLGEGYGNEVRKMAHKREMTISAFIRWLIDKQRKEDEGKCQK